MGRHHVQQSFHQSQREDNFSSTAVPSLGGYGIAELEPFESQARGFQHGHRKKYAIPKTREREVIQLVKEEERNSAAQPVKCVEVRAVALCRNNPIRSLHLTCVTDGPISVARKIHQKTTNAIQAGRRCGARWHHQAITGNHAAGAPWTPRFGAARGSSRVALTLCPLLANFPPRLPSEPHALLQASPEDLPNTST